MTVFKQYNSSTSQWETIVTGVAGPTGAAGATGPAGATGATGATGPASAALDDIGDVTITSATTGNLVQWNGTAWVNSSSLNTAITGVTQTAADSSTKLATTAFVTTADNLKANIASPTFTGTVTGSPAAGTITTGTSGFGYMGLPQNSATTGAYGVVAADAGTHIYSSATRTITLPANATISMPIGSTVVFIAGTGATVTIAITTDTMYLAGTGTTGSRTLAAFGMATAVKITSTSWIISGNGLT
jgi:hypothetical protein